MWQRFPGLRKTVPRTVVFGVLAPSWISGVRRPIATERRRLVTNHPELLRSPNNIFEPDPRSTGFGILGEHGVRPKTLQDQYDAVAEITLHEGVPREIVVKFDNARNLNLFAWFVYRFHSAARTHVYECLELALRVRFKDDLYAHDEQRRRARYEQQAKNNPCKAKPHNPIDKESYRPTLHPLLQYAIEVGALKNEGFSAWQLKTKLRARSRRDIEAIQKMTQLGITELQINDSKIEITDEDREHDYLGQVLKAIPFLRNHYAHGTTSLDNKSLSALRLASEIINQIFPKPSNVPASGVTG
jgi:hypothetical protein